MHADAGGRGAQARPASAAATEPDAPAQVLPGTARGGRPAEGGRGRKLRTQLRGGGCGRAGAGEETLASAILTFLPRKASAYCSLTSASQQSLAQGEQGQRG